MVKMSIPPKVIYRFNTRYIKFSMVFFNKTGKKSSYNSYEIAISKTILQKKNIAGVFILPYFQIFEQI